MTLRERLKTGDLVKIGFKGGKEDEDNADGSKFIFCGTIDKKAINFIEKSSKLEKARLNSERERCARLAKKAINNPAWARKACRFDELYRNWIDYMDREIVEEYESLLNDDVKIILCNGTERGRYWLISEFKANHKWMKKGEDEKPKPKSDEILTLTPENSGIPDLYIGRREFI